MGKNIQDGDFARIFRIDGIGQVLVTIDENEEADDAPCLKLRLPSTGALTPSFSMTYHFDASVTADEIEARMHGALDCITEEVVRKEAMPIMEMAREMARSMGDEA